jgi:hypothetical protein
VWFCTCTAKAQRWDKTFISHHGAQSRGLVGIGVVGDVADESEAAMQRFLV